jgi:hypothetical protein
MALSFSPMPSVVPTAGIPKRAAPSALPFFQFRFFDWLIDASAASSPSRPLRADLA